MEGGLSLSEVLNGKTAYEIGQIVLDGKYKSEKFRLMILGQFAIMVDALEQEKRIRISDVESRAYYVKMLKSIS